MAGLTESLIVTKSIDQGYRWTLASRLGDMLEKAQERFGEKNPSYTFLGIEFSEDGPRNWYPKSHKNSKDIIIQLGTYTMEDPLWAFWQLAHESVHLLSPTGDRNANVLEEGIATHFAKWYAKEILDDDRSSSGEEEYDKACELVEELLNIDSAAIKRLREQEPCISFITEEQIMDLYPTIGKSKAKMLASKFIKYEAS